MDTPQTLQPWVTHARARTLLEAQWPVGDTWWGRDTPELLWPWVTYARAGTPPRVSFGKRLWKSVDIIA